MDADKNAEVWHIVLSTADKQELVVNFRGVPQRFLLGLATSMAINRGIPELGHAIIEGPAPAGLLRSGVKLYSLCSMRPFFLQVGGTCWHAAAVNMLIHCPVVFALIRRLFSDQKKTGELSKIIDCMSDGETRTRDKKQMSLPNPPSEWENEMFQVKNSLTGRVFKNIALEHVFHRFFDPLAILWSTPSVFPARAGFPPGMDVVVRNCPLAPEDAENDGTYILCSVYIDLIVRKAKDSEHHTRRHAICGVMLREPGCSPESNPMQLIIDSNGVIAEYNWTSGLTEPDGAAALLAHLRKINTMYLMFESAVYVSTLFVRKDHVEAAAEEAAKEAAAAQLGGAVSRRAMRSALAAAAISALVYMVSY